MVESVFQNQAGLSTSLLDLLFDPKDGGLVCPSKTVVNLYQTPLHHIFEYSTLHNHHYVFIIHC
jgi:hypothetical protein